MGTDINSREILNSVRMIVRALRVSSRHCEKIGGCTAAQIFIMQRLRHSGTLSINELAAQTLTHQSTVSELIAHMEKAGLIARNRSAEDGRQVNVSLTKKGIRLLGRAPRTAQEELIEAVARFPVKKRGILSGLLKELVNTAGFEQKNPPLFFEEGERKRKYV